MYVVKLKSRYQKLEICTHLKQAYIVCSITTFLYYVGLEDFHVCGGIGVGMQEWHVIVHCPIKDGILKVHCPDRGCHV